MSVGEVDQKSSVRAIRPGIFRSVPERNGDSVVLRGGRCRRCGERFFPLRAFCASCSSPEQEAIDLPSEGLIDTFTVVQQKPAGSAFDPPYAIVNVRIEGGPTVQTVALPPLDHLEVGVRVRFQARVLSEGAGGRVVGFVAHLA